MFKEYKDERINELIKKSFEIAVRDDEWELRYLQEWNILFEDIDKMLEYVENGCKGELRVNSNIWWVLQETLFKVLELYDLQLIGEEKVSENELVVPISRSCYDFKEYDKIIKKHKFDMLFLEIYYNLTCNDKFETLTDKEKEILICFIHRAYLKDETRLDLGYMCDKAIELKDKILKDKILKEDYNTWDFLSQCNIDR